MTDLPDFTPENIGIAIDFATLIVAWAAFVRTGRIRRIARDVADIKLQLRSQATVSLLPSSQAVTAEPTEGEDDVVAGFKIEDEEFELKNKQFAYLIRSEALILDDDEETYVPNPKHMFTYDEVVMMLLGENAD